MSKKIKSQESPKMRLNLSNSTYSLRNFFQRSPRAFQQSLKHLSKRREEGERKNQKNYKPTLVNARNQNVLGSTALAFKTVAFVDLSAIARAVLTRKNSRMFVSS